MKKLRNGDDCHDRLIQNLKPQLSFDDNVNIIEYKSTVKEKLIELSGFNRIAQNSCEPNVLIEYIQEQNTYTKIRFTFESEINNLVPCYLLIPKTNKKSYPVCICLQGHATGFHVSIGEKKYEPDDIHQAEGLQAVENGYAAFCIEQRCLGENLSSRSHPDGKWFPRPHACAHPSLVALSLGRTTIAERVWDVMRGIDVLSQFEKYKLDLSKIMITGDSGGGTTSFYAGCFDERIKYIAPSCGFAPFRHSILDIEHCVCNYIPNISLFFDMQDLAALIAPRHLTIIAGKNDPIFPIVGVKEGFKTIENIYKKFNAENNCRLFITPKAHWWCNDLVWEIFKEETTKMGWC